MRRSDTASRARVEHRGRARARRAPASSVDRVGLAQRLERLLVGVREQLGQHPVDDHRAERHLDLGAQPRDELDRLGDRHLLGRRHDVDRGDRGIGEQLRHPLRSASRTGPTSTSSWIALGRAELGDDVAGRGGVDDDEVEVGAALDRLAHLPADLADR